MLTKGRVLWASGAIAAIALTCALIFGGTQSPSLSEPSDALIAAADGLDEITINADLDTERAVMTVEQTLRLNNRTGLEQSYAMLRTWPNAFQNPQASPCASDELYDACYPNGFSTGALVMSEARVSNAGSGGAQVAYRYMDEEKTALAIPVPNGWQPYEALEISLRYEVYIPRTAYRFGVNDGIWALGNSFAIPAVWEDGAYRTDAYSAVGDPFVSDCANYTVTLSVPDGYECAGSGYPTVETANGRSTYRFSALAVRDFALVVSDRFVSVRAMQDGVLISASATTRAHADEMLGFAKKALSCFSERYGAYPYQSYTLAQISFPMGGMEYPSLVMIATDQLNAGGRTLEHIVAHETAHQWWYAVVGSDSVNQAWQDEALCEFSLLNYVETQYGRSAREELRELRIESAMRVTVPRGVTPGAPLSYFSTMSEYALVVYNRGAAMLCALDQAMDGGLDGFLARYYEQYAFSRASRADFEGLLATHTGEDYAPLITDYLDTHIRN